MSNNENISEQTRTTGRGVKTKGTTSHQQQPNSTRSKADVEQKVAMVKAQGKPNLPKSSAEKLAARARSLKSSSRTEIRSRAQGRGETPKTPDPKKKGPRKNTNSDAPATQGPKGVLPKEGKSVVDHYIRIGQAISEMKATDVMARAQKNRARIKSAEANVLAKTDMSNDAAVEKTLRRGMKARDKNDKVEAGAIDRIVKTGQSKRVEDSFLYAGIGVAIAEGMGLFPVEEAESPSSYAQRNSPSTLGGSSDRGTKAKTTFEKRRARINAGQARRQHGTSSSPNAPKGRDRNFKAMAQGDAARKKLSSHKPTRKVSDAERENIIANRNKGIDSAEKPK